MPEPNAQLIQQITQQVLAMLHQQNATGSTGAAPVDVRPPLGVCTGDYSKFLEMRPREKAGEKDPTCSSGTIVDQPTVTLKGFVTARQLEAVGAKIVSLAPGAKLTPAGADYVRDKGIKVQRATAKTDCGCGGTCCGNKAGKTNATTAFGQWAWWIDGHCPGVDKVVPQYASALAPISARRQTSGLVEACGTIAQRIARGRVAGGVLFVRSAALAACFANRCPSVRAVVGTCTGAVEQGVKQLGANVLIVEYPYHGPESMRQMIDAFVKTPRPNLSQVERQLKELSRCV